MNQNDQTIKYFLYARKSSESDDRQIQSIDDQINKLKQLAESQNLNIVHIFQEAKSAKKPNNRPIFTEMMNRLSNGEADGILCWQMNRLSRNPKDNGDIQWLLQSGKIKSIQTYERQYLPDDNALLLSIEGGMSSQFILDLKKNVKRGMQSKREKGWRPGMAPIGYLNELYDHTIISDPERFPLLRRAWDLMLTGNYTVPKILNKLNNEWGFRTLKKRRIGNNPISMSGLYRIFSSIFYAGFFSHNGTNYNGKHEHMITLEEFDRVQTILGTKGKPRPKTHSFAFSGMIRCSECGCMVTAETKTKLIKSTNTTRSYTYYHCTKQKVGVKCGQFSISDTELDKQILSELNKLELMPGFKEWALDALKSSTDVEIAERTKISEMQQISLNGKQKQLDNLTKMRIRELINDEEFSKEKNELQTDIAKLRDNIKKTELRTDNWLDMTERAFNFASNASKAFEIGVVDAKREILRTIGSEFILDNKTLHFKTNEWVRLINNGNIEIQTLEPKVIGLDNRKTDPFKSVFPVWHGMRESNPR